VGDPIADAMFSETVPAFVNLVRVAGASSAYYCEHGSWPNSGAELEEWLDRESPADPAEVEDPESSVDWSKFDETAEFRQLPSGEFAIRLCALGSLPVDCPEQPVEFRITLDGCDSENQPHGVRVEAPDSP
jgi:hypothetical protein